MGEQDRNMVGGREEVLGLRVGRGHGPRTSFPGRTGWVQERDTVKRSMQCQGNGELETKIILQTKSGVSGAK